MNPTQETAAQRTIGAGLKKGSGILRQGRRFAGKGRRGQAPKPFMHSVLPVHKVEMRTEP